MKKFTFLVVLVAFAVVALATEACDEDYGMIYCTDSRIPGVGIVCGSGGNSSGGGPPGGGNPTPTPTPPPPSATEVTVSRYMTSANIDDANNMGCTWAAQGQIGIVVLAFGAGRLENDVWGTVLLNGVPAELWQIEVAAYEFAAGYAACSPPFGHITLAIGTNNSVPTSQSWWTPTTHYQFGAQWAELITRIHSRIVLMRSGRVALVGANDIETEYNSVANSRAWVDGYDSEDSRDFYNFGNAGGC